MKPEPRMPERRLAQRTVLLLGICCLVPVVLYSPSLRYGFVWDDYDLITTNQFLVQTNPFEIFARGYWHNPDYAEVEMSYYRPVAVLSHYLDRKIWGLNPFGFHLSNIVIHAAVSGLLAVILHRLTGSLPIAILGGLFFGVQPASNSVPVWVAARNYSLALALLLLSFLALLSGLGRRSRGRLIGFGLGYLFGALASEGALVYAAVALVWIGLSRRPGRNYLAWVAVTCAVIPIYLVLRLVMARTPFPPAAAGRALEYPLSIINVFGQQLLLLLVPFIQKITYTMNRELTGLSSLTFLGLFFLIAPLAVALLKLAPGPSGRSISEAGRLLGLGYVWTVVFLLPFGQLMTLAASGRTLYLAVPGVLIFIAGLARASRPPIWLQKVLLAAGVACILAFAGQTLARNPIWQSQKTLYQALAREAPDSPTGLLHQGDLLMARGLADSAIKLFRRAVTENGSYLPARELLSRALLHEQRVPEAIPELQAVVRLDPNNPRAYSDLALAQVQLGWLDSAIANFREAARLDPASPGIRNNLALTLRRAGQFDAAIAEYRAAVRLAPDSDTTLNNLGQALLARGDHQEAASVFRQVLRLNPDFTAAR
ncbi:MAG: tetratricopeptide repeat protein, partial [candidate division WOR-3 bacterium]